MIFKVVGFATFSFGFANTIDDSDFQKPFVGTIFFIFGSQMGICVLGNRSLQKTDQRTNGPSQESNRRHETKHAFQNFINELLF